MIPIHSNSSCSAMGASLVGLRPGTWGIGIMSPYYRGLGRGELVSCPPITVGNWYHVPLLPGL